MNFDSLFLHSWQYLLVLIIGIAAGRAIRPLKPLAIDSAAAKLPAAKSSAAKSPAAPPDCPPHADLQNDQRFYRAFHTAVVGMSLATPNGRFLEVNAALCEFYGYSEAELMQITFRDITYPEDLPYNLELLDRLQKGEISSYQLEKRYIHKQGHTIWGLLNVSMARDAEGQPLYQIALIQDITERKRTEQALQERENLLRSISNNIPKGVLYQLMHDPEDDSLRFTYVSEGIQELLGISAEAVMQDASQFYDLLLEADREQIYCLTQISRELLIDFEAQVQQRNLQGETVWSTVRSVPRRLPDGRTVWDGVAIDITDFKETDTALRQSAARMRAVLQAIPDLVLLTDRQGQGLAYHNGGDVVLLPSKTVQDEGMTVFNTLPDTIARQRIRCIEAALNTGELQTHEYELHVNGKTYCEEARIVASGNDEVVIFIRDITESKRREAVRQQFEAELKQAKEAAEAANQAKSTFLSHVSHELRSPLNTLLGYAQLLARSPNLMPTERQYIDILDRSGNHLLQIINDVLSLARIEAGRVSLKPNPTYLPDLLTNVQLIFQMRAREKGLQVALDTSADLPAWVEIDEGKLRQVLINLLDNAIKFTPAGSVTIGVRLKSLQVLHFTVVDTGVGMSPRDLHSIFEAFVQTESGERSRQGSGLGLAISARLVQLMGGEIWAESQLGQGSALQFTLPFERVRRKGAEPSLRVLGDRSARRVVGLAAGQPQYRILVVDDTEENVHLAEQWLTMAGFEVAVAHSGAEAIEQWQQFSPHLIWMDLRMPEVDGLMATAQIRAREQAEGLQPAQKTKIIAVSATVFQEERQRAFAIGCDDFVSKPYTDEVMLETLQQHLGVTYDYEPLMPAKTEDTPDRDSAEAALDRQLTDLQAMPPEWIAQLNQAARAAREEAIHRLVQQIPAERQALRAAIVHLVDRFQFEQLIEMTKTLC